MQRIPFVDPATLEPEVRKTLEGQPLNVVRISSYASPKVFGGFAGLGAALANNAIYSADVREAVILRVGYLCRSEYELFHHLSIARSLGMSEKTLTAIEHQDYAALEPKMAAAVQFADEVIANGNCGDAALAELRRHYGERGVVDFVFLIGVYMMVARMIAISGIDVDEHALTALARR